MVFAFMNSGNSKTSDSHRLLLNLSDNANLKRRNKYVALSNLNINTYGKIEKSHTKAINLKYQLQLGMKNLNCLMDHTLSDIQDYFKYINKKHEKIGDNPLIKIQVSKRENRITFKI